MTLVQIFLVKPSMACSILVLTIETTNDIKNKIMSQLGRKRKAVYKNYLT